MNWNKVKPGDRKSLPDTSRSVLVSDGVRTWEANVGAHGKWIHPAYNANDEKVLFWAEMPQYSEEIVGVNE